MPIEEESKLIIVSQLSLNQQYSDYVDLKDDLAIDWRDDLNRCWTASKCKNHELILKLSQAEGKKICIAFAADSSEIASNTAKSSVDCYGNDLRDVSCKHEKNISCEQSNEKEIMPVNGIKGLYDDISIKEKQHLTYRDQLLEDNRIPVTEPQNNDQARTLENAITTLPTTNRDSSTSPANTIYFTEIVYFIYTVVLDLVVGISVWRSCHRKGIHHCITIVNCLCQNIISKCLNC